MHSFAAFVSSFHHLLWCGPMLLILLGTHLYFTIRLHFIQRWTFLGIRLSLSASSNEANGISPFASLSTALAATIGTGNIIGISTAIALGGPGAVFWCWLSGLLGIATCYSECFLSSRFRQRQADGSYIGGPMYLLRDVLSHRGLSVLFALFAMLASLGIGSSVQSHSIYAALSNHCQISPHLVGIITAFLAGLVMLGGIKQISSVCTFLVPFMSLFYISGCIFLLILNHSYLFDALKLILTTAFMPKSIISGISSGGLMLAFRIGVSRGLFTNEAGLGSIPMAAAASNASLAWKQGLISMTGVFWDTVVICAITGLVIVSSFIKNPLSYQNIAPDSLCFSAFSQIPYVGTFMLSVSLILFAFATILGWCYYGECGAVFLFGKKGVPFYQFIYLLSIYLGAVLSLSLIWDLSDLFNSFMILPNVFCLWSLRKIIIAERPRFTR